MIRERIHELESNLSPTTQRFLQCTAVLVGYEGELSGAQMKQLEDEIKNNNLHRADFDPEDLSGDGPYTEEAMKFGKMANHPAYWTIRTLNRVQELLKAKEEASNPVAFHGMKAVHINSAVSQATDELGTKALHAMIHSYVMVFTTGLVDKMIADFYKEFAL